MNLERGFQPGYPLIAAGSRSTKAASGGVFLSIFCIGSRLPHGAPPLKGEGWRHAVGQAGTGNPVRCSGDVLHPPGGHPPAHRRVIPRQLETSGGACLPVSPLRRATPPRGPKRSSPGCRVHPHGGTTLVGRFQTIGIPNLEPSRERLWPGTRCAILGLPSRRPHPPGRLYRPNASLCRERRRIPFLSLSWGPILVVLFHLSRA